MNNNIIIIFKNDAVGDLVHSVAAIINLIKKNKDTKIILYLSERSESFKFIFDYKNIEVKKINYNLTIVEKINIFYFLLFNKISKIYILAPKNYYYYLPFFFKKIKFYSICINGINNYKRPNQFLRNYLFKYKINDRGVAFKRESTKSLQQKLITENNFDNFDFKIKLNISNQLKQFLPKRYIYFHLKKKIFDELGWGLNELDILFKNFKRKHPNIVLTKDIEIDENTTVFKKKFNAYDFKTEIFINNNSNVTFFDNIEGENLYNVIKYSDKVVAFHGMMTNLASLEKKPVLDLFYCKINSWEDYRKYRNSFYEFKPKYPNYNFIIPKKDISKTINKIKFFI